VSMTNADLECLKANVDRYVEIDTKDGEHLVIKVIYVFDQESDPDVFFDLAPQNVDAISTKPTSGYSLPLADIIAVRVPRQNSIRP